MLDALINPDFKFRYVLTQFLKKQELTKSAKIHNKLDVLENIFYDLSHLNQAEHYYLLDINSPSYSLSYDKKIMSKHSANIHFLSLVLEKVNYPNEDDPINKLYQLEQLITNAQFYKNALLGEVSKDTHRLIRNLIERTIKAANHLEDNNSESAYQATLIEEKQQTKQPNTLSAYLDNVRLTCQHLKFALRQIRL